MSAAHTPGPWTMTRYAGHAPQGDWPGVIGNEEANQVVFAGPFSFRALRGATPEEAEANARLIAAAPDLLAALVRIIDETPAAVGPLATAIRDGLRAIAKATDEAPTEGER